MGCLHHFWSQSRLNLMMSGLGMMLWMCGICQGLQAETLNEIQTRGVIRVGVKNNLPLLGQVDRDGHLVGFEIELAQVLTTLIWGENQIKVDYIPLLNQARLSAIATGKVDIAIANIHTTESRRRVVAFSQPYLASQTRVVSSAPTAWGDLEDGTIGVLQGSIAIARVRSTFPNARLLGVSSYSEAVQKLKSGEIDHFAGDRLIVTGWQFGAPRDLGSGKPLLIPKTWHFSEKGMGRSNLAIAMPKGLQHQNLHQAINLAIDTLESTGQLQQMRNKWRLSEADGAAVVRLETSLASRVMLRPMGSTNVLLTCGYGSVVNFSLFDSPFGVASGCGRFCVSTGAQNSSRGKEFIGATRQAQPIERQHSRIF